MIVDCYPQIVNLNENAVFQPVVNDVILVHNCDMYLLPHK